MTTMREAIDILIESLSSVTPSQRRRSPEEVRRQRAAIETRLARTANKRARAAIGRPITLRTGPNTVINGHISGARLDHLAWVGSSCTATWKIEVEWAGSTGIVQHRVCTVDRL